MLMLATLITVTLLSFCCWGFTQYAVTKDELNSATLIADKLYFTTYIQKGFKGPDKIIRRLDIHIADRPFIIRLNDNFNSAVLDAMQRKFPDGGTVEILYDNTLLQDSILYNPHEIKINGETFIGLDDTKDLILRISTCVFAAALLFGFVSLLAFRTYKQLMWEGDKAIYRESKWIFIKRWFREK